MQTPDLDKHFLDWSINLCLCDTRTAPIPPLLFAPKRFKSPRYSKELRRGLPVVLLLRQMMAFFFFKYKPGAHCVPSLSGQVMESLICVGLNW